MAGSVVPVVRQKAQVFIRVLGLFQAFAFHPFIEQLARILKSIKLNEFFWGPKAGLKICDHCFVE